jgi:hypothetical protein
LSTDDLKNVYGEISEKYAHQKIPKSAKYKIDCDEIEEFKNAYKEIEELKESKEYYNIIERENLANFFDIKGTNGNDVAGVVTYNLKEKDRFIFDIHQFPEVANKAHEFKHLIL